MSSAEPLEINVITNFYKTDGRQRAKQSTESTDVVRLESGLSSMRTRGHQLYVAENKM